MNSTPTSILLDRSGSRPTTFMKAVVPRTPEQVYDEARKFNAPDSSAIKGFEGLSVKMQLRDGLASLVPGWHDAAENGLNIHPEFLRFVMTLTVAKDGQEKHFIIVPTTASFVFRDEFSVISTEEVQTDRGMIKKAVARTMNPSDPIFEKVLQWPGFRDAMNVVIDQYLCNWKSQAFRVPEGGPVIGPLRSGEPKTFSFPFEPVEVGPNTTLKDVIGQVSESAPKEQPKEPPK